MKATIKRGEPRIIPGGIEKVTLELTEREARIIASVFGGSNAEKLRERLESSCDPVEEADLYTIMLLSNDILSELHDVRHRAW